MIQGERYKSIQIICHNSTPAPDGQKLKQEDIEVERGVGERERTTDIILL